MRTIYQPCGKRGFIVVVKSRRKKKKKKERDHPSSPSPSHRPRGNSSLIKIFILQRFFPITSSDAATLFAYCRRYRAHIVASGENRVIGSARTSRYVAQFFTRLSRDDVSASARKCFPFFPRRACVSPFCTRNFRGTRKRDFCESASSVCEGDDRRRRERGMDQLSRRYLESSLSLFAAEIGPNRVNGELCKL